MKQLKDIQFILAEHKPVLFSKYPLKSLAIFGSYSKNTQSEDSDLDIMVEFNDGIGIKFIDLAEELEDYLDLKVDLVSRKGIKERYFQSIKPDLIYV